MGEEYEAKCQCDNCGFRATFTCPKGQMLFQVTKNIKCDNCGVTGYIMLDTSEGNNKSY